MHSEDTVVCEEIRGELQYLGENGDQVIYNIFWLLKTLILG